MHPPPTRWCLRICRHRRSPVERINTAKPTLSSYNGPLSLQWAMTFHEQLEGRKMMNSNYCENQLHHACETNNSFLFTALLELIRLLPKEDITAAHVHAILVCTPRSSSTPMASCLSTFVLGELEGLLNLLRDPEYALSARHRQCNPSSLSLHWFCFIHCSTDVRATKKR